MSARQLDLFSVENTEVYRQALPESIGGHTLLTEPVSGRGETFVNVQRQFEKAGQFNFMGAEKIASPRDVAYIFRCLETAAVENAFGVFIKDGKATVLHLGMGNAMQTPLDFDAMIAADAKLRPDKVYFVHNHPSGTLKASDQDVALYEYIESYFGKRLQPCIIINTRSGQYVTFVGREQQIEQQPQNTIENEVPLETYSFSQQVFSKDYVESDNLLDLSHVASFLSGQRLGARDKFSYLVVSNNLQVMANIHTPYSTIGKADIDELARKMRQDVALFGGRGVIGYGSAKIPKQVLSKLKEKFEKIGGVDMIDFVNVRRKIELSQNLEVTNLAYAYESAFTQNVVELKGEVEKSEIDKISLDKDKQQGNVSTSNRKIDDFGEKIWGARKDILRELAQRMDDVTEASLLELPFAKVWKKPDLKKLVDGGLLTEDDAVVAEAVMQGMIFIPKPRPSKRDQRIAKYYGTKTAVEQWAERVHTGIKMLRDVIVLQGEEKRDCIQKVMEFEENGFKPIGFIAEVIKNIGYTTGENLSLPAARIEYGYDGKMYIETEAGKRRVHSLEQAGDIAVQLAKIKRGDNDIPFFTNDITVQAEKPIFEKDGRYEVAYLKGRSVTPKYKLFAGSENAEQEAMAFAKDIEAEGGVAKVIACKKATGKYETYSIAFRNPLTDERMVHSSYPDMETAEKVLEEHRPGIEDSFRQRLSSEGTMKTEKKKVSQDANFDIYISCGKYVVGIPPKKSPTGEFLQVSPSFEDRNAVHRWLDENRPQLEHQYATYKADMKKFVYLETRLDDRQGADYRQGKDVTPEMFSSTFGFRGVQFGNWTNDLDRQAALNSTYDALMDLSRVVGKSPRAISLNGELGLAFGARGSGSADAHYEPKMVVINLTKTRGGGSLAHEWWHAMDNYFSRQADVPAGYMTTAKRERVGVRPEVRTAFKSLVEAVVDSPFGKRSARLGTYWGDNREMTARLFGEWVGQKLNEKGEYNHFLTTQIREATVAQVRGMNYMLYGMGRNKEELMSREEFDKLPDSLAGFPYPTAEETKTFGRLLDSLYQTMEEKVDVTTGKTMLYDDGVRYGEDKKKTLPETATIANDSVSTNKATVISSNARANANTSKVTITEKKQVTCRPSRGCKL